MGLKDKASKINFAALAVPEVVAPEVAEGGAPISPEVRRPKTAPGAMMAFATDQRSSLLKENEQLRVQAGKVEELRGQLDEALEDLKEWDGAKATRLLDPATVRRSAFANRHLSGLQGADFDQLKAEIKDAGGNVQPIKVRVLSEPIGGVAYELVFGHRRHEACRQLNLPVLALVDNLDDRALFVEMERENRGRKDLSAWEQGVMYRRALSEGLFPSNRKLAEAIGVDLGAVGKALALAELPDAVIAAFASPLDLQFRWAKPLNDAYRADPKEVLHRSEQIQKGAVRPSAREVFEQLTAPGKGRGVEPFNPPPALALKLKGREVGTLTMGPDQKVVISLNPGVVAVSDLTQFQTKLEHMLLAK